MSTRLEQDKGKTKGKQAWIAAVVVAGLAFGGWWYSHIGQPSNSTPAQVTAQQASSAPAVKEVPGAMRKIDVAAQLKQDQNAPVGTEARKVYEAAIAQINQVKPTIDKALSETTGPVVVISDTSGSMGNEIETTAAVNQYLSGISAVRPVTAIYVDDQVRGIEQLAPGYPGVLVGGGVTSFVPGFAHLAGQGARPGLAIYVTDGLCSDFPADPGYPVLWLLVRPSLGFRPPFGVVAGQ